MVIAHAMTTAQHRARFPQLSDELSPAGILECARVAAGNPGRLVLSPATAAAQTADALGWARGESEPLVAEQDYGPWAGRELAHLSPEQLREWASTGDLPGGESLADLTGRVGSFLHHAPSGRTTVITHQSVLRCAVITVLGGGAAEFWRIEAEPLAWIEVRRGGTGRLALHFGSSTRPQWADGDRAVE